MNANAVSYVLTRVIKSGNILKGINGISFRMRAHTKKEKKRPFSSTSVISRCVV
jgi:hypothetical protein